MSENLTVRTSMPVPSKLLADWHFRPGAFERLIPPWEWARLISTTGPLKDGARWVIRVPIVGPIAMKWHAEIHDLLPERQFCDRQLHGPFAQWDHSHRFLPDGENAILEDAIEYRPPFGHLGRLARTLIRDHLRQMFTYRHAITRSDLEQHARYSHQPRLTIAITGSRGLIGSELVPFLTTGGHRVRRLVTGSFRPGYDDGTEWQAWNPQRPLEAGQLDGVDAVVHLAGDNIAEGRWTASKRARLRDSRVTPTRNLAEACARSGVKAFLSGSAIGIYGNRGDEILTESQPPGVGFLSDLAHDWEQAAEPAQKASVRTVSLRTGIVISARGGVLGKQLFPFRMGGGAILGNGRQWVSWIGMRDMIYAIHHLLMRESLQGPFNLVAPQPVTNREFAKTLGRVLHRPVLLSLPRLVLKAIFGEMVDDLFLASTRVQPTRLQESGFAFQATDLESELRWQLGLGESETVISFS